MYFSDIWCILSMAYIEEISIKILPSNILWGGTTDLYI